MHITIFTKISIWQVLGAIILFPTMLFFHIWEFTLYLTRDLAWSLFFAQMGTLSIMSVLYEKLFFGVGWLEALHEARGTLFLQFFLSVLFVFCLLAVGPMHLSEKSAPEFIFFLIAVNTMIQGMLFIGMLAYASASSLIDGEV